MIDGVLTTATIGLRNNAANAADAADRLVRGVSRPAGDSPATSGAADRAQGVALSEQDILKAVLDLKQAETGFKANASVFRAGDRMTGTLIDLLA